MTISSTSDVVATLNALLAYFSQSSPSTSTSYVGTIFSVVPEVGGSFGTPTGAVDVKIVLDTPPTDGSSSVKTFTFFKPPVIILIGAHGTLVVQSAPSPGDYEILVSFTVL